MPIENLNITIQSNPGFAVSTQFYDPFQYKHIQKGIWWIDSGLFHTMYRGATSLLSVSPSYPSQQEQQRRVVAARWGGGGTQHQHSHQANIECNTERSQNRREIAARRVYLPLSERLQRSRSKVTAGVTARSERVRVRRDQAHRREDREYRECSRLRASRSVIVGKHACIKSRNRTTGRRDNAIQTKTTR